MTANFQWEDDSESGTTLGPEEALRREIERTKALKVERLRLRDEVEKLRAENLELREENRKLATRMGHASPPMEPAPPKPSEKTPIPHPPHHHPVIFYMVRISSILAVGLLGWLFYFFLTL